MLGVGDFEAGVDALPLPEAERGKLRALLGGKRDFLEGLSLGEKFDYATATAYNRFLVERVGLAPGTVPLLDPMRRLYYDVTGWKLSVLEALFMVQVPTPSRDEPVRELLRADRARIYATSFAEYERQIRTQLRVVLGPQASTGKRTCSRSP